MLLRVLKEHAVTLYCQLQAVKDSIDVQGYPTTGATPALAGELSESQVQTQHQVLTPH